MADPLQLAVHLADGSVRSFAQPDLQAAARAISRLHPERVFDEPVLLFGSPRGVATVRTSAVLRIEVRGPVPDDWPIGPGIDAITVIDAAEYAADGVTPAELSPRTGEPYVVHAEARDVAGGSLFLRVEGRVMPEAVRVHRLERMMDRPCLLARRPDGTAVLIRLANVALFAVRPVLQLPGKAIEVHESTAS